MANPVQRMTSDSHVHCFPPQVFDALWRWFRSHAWEINYPFYAAEVLNFLDEQGVKQAMILNYAHKPGMATWLNQWTRELMKDFPQHAYLGAFHQEDENLEKNAVDLLDGPGFAGVKLHSHVQKVAPDDSRLWPLYEVAMDQGKVVLFHCGDEPRSPGYGFDTDSVSGVWRLRKVFSAFPDLKLIIPHFGAGDYEGTSELLREFPTLMVDSAMILTDFLRPSEERFRLLEEFPGRILFGTDFPNIPYSYREEEKVLQGRGEAIFDSVKKTTDAFVASLI